MSASADPPGSYAMRDEYSLAVRAPSARAERRPPPLARAFWQSEFGDPISGTRRTPMNALDGKSCSEAHDRTRKRGWTSRMGLRSRHPFKPDDPDTTPPSLATTPLTWLPPLARRDNRVQGPYRPRYRFSRTRSRHRGNSHHLALQIGDRWAHPSVLASRS